MARKRVLEAVTLNGSAYRRLSSERIQPGHLHTRGDVKPRPPSHLSPPSLFVRYAACIVGRKFVALTHRRGYKPDSYLSIIDRAPKREQLSAPPGGKEPFLLSSFATQEKKRWTIPRMDDFVSNNNQSRGNTNLTTGSAAVKNSGEGS